MLSSTGHTMEDREWLKSQIARELDLIMVAPKHSRFIRDEEGRPIAHYTLMNRWGLYELTTVVVDPKHQGKGISHQIIENCENPVCSFTKNERLAKALTKAGFKEAWWPGFLPFINMMFERHFRVLQMIFLLQWKRCFHQCLNLFNYRMYIRK